MANLVFVDGTLARDPHFSYTPRGTPVCTFTVTNTYKFRHHQDGFDMDISDFDIEAWRDLAEKCNEFEKGTELEIEGRLKQIKWETPQGEKRSIIKIVAKEVNKKRK